MSDPNFIAIAQEITAARGLTFVREVGAGAFKVTFEVRADDGSALALKIYQRGADVRTEREVDAITRCTHPGIARFRSLEGWKDGANQYTYSLEEFLGGGTLAERIRAGALPPSDIRRLARALVDAVGHVASLDLVHRDLKPDNIMFRTAGGDEPVIVDFGLVRDLAQTSITKTWQAHGPGTPLYASPEQLNNEKALIDWRSDQFSLGVVLTMCGRSDHPYALAGLHIGQVIERVSRRETPSPDFVSWAQGLDLNPLVRMLDPWPIARFRTPQLLAAAWSDVGGQ